MKPLAIRQLCNQFVIASPIARRHQNTHTVAGLFIEHVTRNQPIFFVTFRWASFEQRRQSPVGTPHCIRDHRIAASVELLKPLHGFPLMFFARAQKFFDAAIALFGHDGNGEMSVKMVVKSLATHRATLQHPAQFAPCHVVRLSFFRFQLAADGTPPSFKSVHDPPLRATGYN